MNSVEVDIAEFDLYVEQIKEGGPSRPLVDKQSTDIRLKLYGLGRQGSLGDNNEPKPGMFALVEKKKWEAWMANKGMAQEEAKRQFLVLCKQIGVKIN